MRAAQREHVPHGCVRCALGLFEPGTASRTSVRTYVVAPAATMASLTLLPAGISSGPDAVGCGITCKTPAQRWLLPSAGLAAFAQPCPGVLDSGTATVYAELSGASRPRGTKLSSGRVVGVLTRRCCPNPECMLAKSVDMRTLDGRGRQTCGT